MGKINFEQWAEFATREMGVQPGDGFALADALKLRAEGMAGLSACGLRVRDRVFYNLDSIPQRQHGTIAHECAHVLLDRWNAGNTESNARQLGPRLFLPRSAVVALVGRHGLDIRGMKAELPTASGTLLCRRVADVYGGRFASWKDGALVYSRGYGPRGPGKTLSELQRLAESTGKMSGRGESSTSIQVACPLGDGWVGTIDLPLGVILR